MIRKLSKLHFCYLLLFVITAVILAKLAFGANSYDVREVCESKKGIWREFGDDCANNCALEGRNRIICVPKITYSCDCPKDQCWDYYRCVEKTQYQTEASAAEAERIAKLKETNPELFIDSRVVNEQRINKPKKEEETSPTEEEEPKTGTPAVPATPTPVENKEKESDSTPEIAQCVKAGGAWKEFQNGCADNCSNKKYPALCISSITQSCDCPEDKCWNGSTCVLTATF